MKLNILFLSIINIILYIANCDELLESENVNFSNDEYVFIQEITRHGSRTAFAPYIPSKLINEYGIGELTPLGFRQHYVLGKILKEKYSQLFGRRLRNEELWIRSTGFNRTIQSGDAHLQGIFDDYNTDPIDRPSTSYFSIPRFQNTGEFNTSNLKFNTALPQKYQPYPIYTPNDGHFDRFLKADDEGGKVCNATFPLREIASENFVKYINSSRLLQDTQQQAYTRYNMYDSMIEQYGLNFTNGFLVSDAVICETENNPNFDINLKDPKDFEFYQNLKKVYSLAIFQFYNSTEYSRTVQTPVLNDIRININRKYDIAIENLDDSIDPRKYVLLSAHDSTMAQILLNNGFYDHNCLINEFMSGVDGNCYSSPGPASSLIFELVKKSDKNYIVRFNYEGKYIDFCKLKQNLIPGSWPYECSIKKFNEVIDSMVVPDFNKACFGTEIPKSQMAASSSINISSSQNLLDSVEQFLKILIMGVISMILLILLYKICKVEYCKIVKKNISGDKMVYNNFDNEARRSISID